MTGMSNGIGKTGPRDLFCVRDSRSDPILRYGVVEGSMQKRGSGRGLLGKV